MGRGSRIVLTADRTLMSGYNGHIFLGFSACVPRGIIPDRLYFSIFCPPVEAEGDGSARLAPCGTRKIEAALLEYGFRREDVIVAHPEHLGKAVGPETKVLGITENDPLGIGPATSTFTQLFGGEAYMALKFRELLMHPSIKLYRPKIIVGGPGAWQIDEEARRRLGIDCVVVGEGEKVVGPLFEKAVRGERIPERVEGEAVEVERIPVIRGATINGIIEIARGCGRGCAFCIPTLQNYRCLPIEHILKEVEVNRRAGKDPLLHAEDVLRYGAKGLEINREAVLDLFKAVKGYPGVENVGISHFALASVVAAPDLVEEISKILGAGERGRFIGGQTGIETGSPRLIRRHMLGKCKPYQPEEWPEVVLRAFEILSENSWVPCATIILGLPGETDRDAEETARLVEELRPFKSLIVPLFLVSAGGLKRDSESFTLEKMTRVHGEAFIRCWEHNIYWIPEIFNERLKGSIKNRIIRRGLNLIVSYGLKKGKELIKRCKEEYDYDIKAMIKDFRKGTVEVDQISALPQIQRY